jgi:hypothetical protein
VLKCRNSRSAGWLCQSTWLAVSAKLVGSFWKIPYLQTLIRFCIRKNTRACAEIHEALFGCACGKMKDHRQNVSQRILSIDSSPMAEQADDVPATPEPKRVRVDLNSTPDSIEDPENDECPLSPLTVVSWTSEGVHVVRSGISDRSRISD